MPTWQENPPDERGPYAFRILRTPPAKAIRGIITCTDPVGCATHFIKNRTVPCEGQDTCQACHEGFSWRWHGYVSCILTPGYEHVLFEYTATASDTFRQYYTINATLRACIFVAQRPSGRANGRAVIHCTRADEAQLRLPDPPDIRRILCHIWNVRYEPHNSPMMARPPARAINIPHSDDDGRYRP